ncbi:MAG: hypothetical protein A3J76_02400 [Candidatus Moranbacteria bacterium RBG_13_45_13]|nr:MAG: hypothetical protein A3J76_02400 [Candidatus Moranbacteria bacterium RBG_13_45_13]
MARKKILMFYGKEKAFKKDPFEDKGLKKSVYYYFFQKGSRLGFDMYLVMGREKYMGGLKFRKPLFFNPAKENFEVLDQIVEVDAVLDRSGGTRFPPLGISEKVLDNRKFKLICWNKILMYKYLRGFSPPSYGLKSFKGMRKNLRFFRETELVVLKPASGLKGKDVHIDYPSKILQLRDIDFGKGWVLQKFVDTSGGINGLVRGRHDLRIAIVNGKMVFSHIRQPRSSCRVANVAQGGSIKEIAIRKIPKQILKKTKGLQQKIDADFDRPLYSIDFGIQNKEPFVFEINDSIGFPSEKMTCYKKFINNVLEALSIRAMRNNH